MFGNNKLETKGFSRSFCDGYNTGIALVKKFPPEKREDIKEILHSILQERNKDIKYHGIFSGFCYQIIQEQYQSRMKQIQQIREQDKARNNDLER